MNKRPVTGRKKRPNRAREAGAADDCMVLAMGLCGWKTGRAGWTRAEVVKGRGAFGAIALEFQGWRRET